jgi:hypothetical protein
MIIERESHIECKTEKFYRVLVWSSNTIAELGASFNSLKEKLKDYIDEDITDLIIDRGNLNDKRLKNEKDQYYEDEMKRCNKVIADIEDLNSNISLIYKFKIRRMSTKEIEYK